MWRLVRQFLKRLHTEFPYEQTISFLDIDSRELKTGTETDGYLHVNIQKGMIYSSQKVEMTQVYMDR